MTPKSGLSKEERNALANYTNPKSTAYRVEFVAQLNDLVPEWVPRRSRTKRRPPWSVQEIRAESKKYDSRQSFSKRSPGAYSAAHKLGVIDQVCGHMRQKAGSPGYWTDATLALKAREFTSRVEFRNKASWAYKQARVRRLMGKICAHMGRPSVKWSKKELIEKALEYQRRSDFERGAKGAYLRARRLGLLDTVCAHMDPPHSSKWREDELLRQGLRFRKRSDFKRNSAGAYEAARRFGLLDRVCRHMTNDLRS